MTTALFTSSGTWNAPAGVSSVTAQCWGGGGGGAEASSGTGSGGGGGGGEFAQATVAVTPGSPYTVTVGAAGAGGSGAEGTGNGANGANGGNTTFPGDSVTVTAHGGHGGAFNPKPSGTGTGGAGGTGSANQIHFDGGAGGSGNAAGQGGGGGSSGGGQSAGNAGGSSSTGAGTITIVQSAQAVSLGTSATVTLGSPTTAGNCLVAVIQSPSVAGVNQFVSGVTIGGLKDNWAALASYGTTGSWTVCSFWADPNCTSGQTVVRVTCVDGTGTLSVAVSVFEVTGIVATGPLDKTAGVLNNSSSSWSSGATGVTSQAAEIAFGNAGAAATLSGPGSPWVNLAGQNDGVGDFSLVGYNILSSTGTQAYSGTLSQSALYTAAIATLKGSGGVSGAPAPAVVLGGPGGSGAGSGAAGSAPASGPGGGGGASASSNKDGGAGFAGQVILTWAATAPPAPPVPNPPVETPGPTASVLAGITGADPANIYSATDPTQRRQAIVSGSGTPLLPSLMTDVVFMPEFAILDANITVTGTISAEAGVDVTVPGQGLSVVEGTNCKQGTGTLVAGSAVVANTSVTANSRIFITSQADGGTPGWLRVSTRAAGVSFTVTSSSGSDTSTFAFEIYEPG